MKFYAMGNKLKQLKIRLFKKWIHLKRKNFILEKEPGEYHSYYYAYTRSRIKKYSSSVKNNNLLYKE